MFFFLIFASIIFTIATYRLKKTRMRYPTSVSGVHKTLGHDTVTISCSCLVLSLLLLFMLTQGPDLEEQQKELVQRELDARRIMAEYLTRKVMETADPQAKVMVIDRAEGDMGQAYHEAAMAGVEAALEEKGELAVTHLLKSEEKLVKETDRAEALTIDSAEVDELIKQHEDCTVVVSLAGLPDEYENSSLWLGVSEGTILFGVYTDDVYLLGHLFAKREITACAVPKRVFNYEEVSLNTANVEESFDRRFIFINAENLIPVAKKYPRLIWRSKVL